MAVMKMADLIRLIRFLRDGKKLEKPAFRLQSASIGELMERCWEKEPGDRPIFNDLERELGNTLEESIQE